MSQVLNDREKNNYTKFNDIKLIRISYFDMKNLEEEIEHKQQSQPDSMDKSLDLMKKLNDFLGK